MTSAESCLSRRGYNLLIGRTCLDARVAYRQDQAYLRHLLAHMEARQVSSCSSHPSRTTSYSAAQAAARERAAR
jgi:hypothetical protein